MPQNNLPAGFVPDKQQQLPPGFVPDATPSASPLPHPEATIGPAQPQGVVDKVKNFFIDKKPYGGTLDSPGTSIGQKIGDVGRGLAYGAGGMMMAEPLIDVGAESATMPVGRAVAKVGGRLIRGGLKSAAGATVGGGVGAGIGSMVGHPKEGAQIGATVGGLAGPFAADSAFSRAPYGLNRLILGEEGLADSQAASKLTRRNADLKVMPQPIGRRVMSGAEDAAIGGSGKRPSPSEAEATNLVRKTIVSPEEYNREQQLLGNKATRQPTEGLMGRENRLLGDIRSRRAARGMREPK